MTEKRQHSVAEAAYLAGIIDGEGSICISKSPGKNGRSICYQAFIGVSNTEKGLIDWLHSTFGGTHTQYTPKQTPSNSRKHVWRWQVTGRNIDYICELILPYSTIKQEEINVMLQMRSTFSHCHYKGHQGSTRVKPEHLALREECHVRLRELHNRCYF